MVELYDAASRPAPSGWRTSVLADGPPKIVMSKSTCVVRAEGLEPPQLSSLEPKSSASTNSATPAKSIMSGRDAAGGGL